MKELVLDLVASCEHRISMVEQLITGAYYTTASLDESLAESAEKRAGLKTSLQEILARNCSLRRKDFNALMQRIISESERRKGELEEERKHVRDELKEYLNEQKQLVASLRQQLRDFIYEKEDRDTLEATIAKMKVAYQDKGQQVFALLREFQLRLEAFQREQEEINQKLQRLVERGEALRLGDLRQLEAAKAGQERRAERELRRQEVERLLAHFKGQRQGGSRYRR
jgi:chromosome segregation ATPase